MLDDRADGVDRFELAQICQVAENQYVGVQSGLMDQFAESCGVQDAALLLDCRSSEWRAITLPAELAIVVCHTGSSRKLDRSDYNVRRSQCEAAVAALAAIDPGVRSLRDATTDLLERAGDKLDPIAARRARHVVAENERVGQTVAALAAGDLATVGELFAASHASLRDLFEVSSPELDAMVDIVSGVPGVVATRMTGAGFGGCTVTLVERDAIDAVRTTVEREYLARTNLTPMVLPVRAVAGAGRLA